MLDKRVRIWRMGDRENFSEISMFDDLFEPKEIQCGIGVLFRDGSEIPIPFFLCDYGVSEPSFEDMMRRYNNISLDINPAGKDKKVRW